MIRFHHSKPSLRSVSPHSAFWIAATLSFALGCNDDGPASRGTQSTDGPPSESESGPDTDTGDGSESESDTETETETETETGEETDTGPDPVCEAEEPLGDWLFMLADGDFPNDVPEDVDESCTVLDGPADQITLDCPFGEFALILQLSPMPPLPDAGATAQVRIHHEPGWQLWPDLWISVDVDSGDHFGFQISSVVAPIVGGYAVPHDPTLTAAQCGPFVLGGLGGEDPCGEQVGHEIEFDVDGESVLAWHGTHTMVTIGERAFEAWINAAREYASPPEFCDISPTWYSIVTRREPR